jgi:hypothetical protein
MEKITLTDLPDNLFDEIMGAREKILNVLECHYPNIQLAICELLLAETIYFNVLGKDKRREAAQSAYENILHNFPLWDKRLSALINDE